MDRAGSEGTRPGRWSLAMSCAVPVLLICGALSFSGRVDASVISSRLPKYILLNTTLRLGNPPVRMDHLAVRWDHNGSPLVEYQDGRLTFHRPGAMMSVEQLQQGNISLVLTNLTLNTSGRYKCVVQYEGAGQSAVYSVVVEPKRIRLYDLTLSPQTSDDLTPGRRLLRLHVAPVITRIDDSIIPESAPQHRRLKHSLVLGVVVLGGILFTFLFFCLKV
ncbi:uncharacterized protein [Engystomops pustulosus]|uniref:uncharacterized protein isoform X1 n=1 Tax=Engystomops pustulosus TaxID=76066 RepID=UPI003AFA75B7